MRFLAAFYVVLFHGLPFLSSRFHLPAPLVSFLSHGGTAVSFFFLLSGFILAYTYDGQISAPGGRARFWQARFARIYPVYLLSLLLALWFEHGLRAIEALVVLLMIQTWNPRTPGFFGAWNYPAWTLSVEAFFYLCFPFVLPLLSRCSVRTLRWLSLLLLGMCVFTYTPLRELGTHDAASFAGRFIPLPLQRLPEFLLGMTLGLAFLRKTSPGPPTWRVTVSLFTALLVLGIGQGHWTSLVMIPFAQLVYDLAFDVSWLSRVLSSRIMLLLGGASYGVYLLQYPIRSWIRVLISTISPRSTFLGAVITPLVLVAFSILVFLYWEEPARRAVRRWFAAVDFRPRLH